MGVVNHANYFRYFEFSRIEFFRSHGRNYRDLERDGILLPVVEANAQYKAPARYDDLLVIRPTLSEVRRVSLTFTYEIVRDEEPSRILCTGHTVHACVGRDGRPTRLPDVVAELLKKSP
jgi:acyl-CoA thioester hydrolase